MKTVVGFLSRPHGYNVLTSIIDNPDLKLLKVFTHKLKPKSEDPNRSIRTDYDFFLKLCQENNIIIESVDSKESANDLLVPDCDYIVEVSWRYLILQNIVKKARIVAFGIHRGKLPEYAGREPIKQAIKNGENEIILSAHYLDPVIDGGDVISTKSYKISYNTSITTEENIKQIREAITPLFSELSLDIFKKFC